jgi:hypothetical protein
MLLRRQVHQVQEVRLAAGQVQSDKDDPYIRVHVCASWPQSLINEAAVGQAIISACQAAVAQLIPGANPGLGNATRPGGSLADPGREAH